MKVLALNGSPRKKGNTSILIQEVFKELNAEGIETEEINFGSMKLTGCMACKKCAVSTTGKCIFDDGLTELVDKMGEADGILLGSPVYCADVTGQMKCFLDRAVVLSFIKNNLLARKVGASIVAVRRAGALPAFNTMNSFLSVTQMITVGSGYWNMGYGLEKGEVLEDNEGINTMKNLGKNMAWVLKSIKESRSKIKEPETNRTH